MAIFGLLLLVWMASLMHAFPYLLEDNENGKYAMQLNRTFPSLVFGGAYRNIDHLISNIRQLCIIFTVTILYTIVARKTKKVVS